MRGGKRPEARPRKLKSRGPGSAALKVFLAGQHVLNAKDTPPPARRKRFGLERTNVVAANAVAEEKVEREHFSLPSCAVMRDSLVNEKLTEIQYGFLRMATLSAARRDLV